MCKDLSDPINRLNPQMAIMLQHVMLQQLPVYIFDCFLIGQRYRYYLPSFYWNVL